MTNVVGKTIARLEENAPGYKGAPDESIVVLHFTDGTALRLSGWGSDMDAGIDHVLLSAEDVAENARAAEAYRQDQATEAREREEWMALTCGQ